MKSAVPLAELGKVLFPEVPGDRANRALTVLLALGSRARKTAGDPSLLPCRIHSFFRGLLGLWVCMDPQCTEINQNDAVVRPVNSTINRMKDAAAARLYSISYL